MMLLLWWIVAANAVRVAFALVSGWGEPCNHTAECADHRMVCRLPTNGSGTNLTKCACDRFHEWRGIDRGCVQVVDTETILNMTIVSNDNQGELEKDQQQIYFGHKIAGFFVMSVALICPLVVAIHCCHMKRKDRLLKNDLMLIKERVEEAKNRRAGFSKV